MVSLYDLFAPDQVVTVGPVVALPTGPRGRGVVSFSYDTTTSQLIAHMTDGTDEPASLPVGSGGGDITSGDPSTTVPLSQDVINYVQSQLGPIRTTDTTQTGRIDAIDSAYLSKTAAATTYAPLAHTHAIADVSGLQPALDGKLAKPATATNGQILAFDGTNWVPQTPPAAPDLAPYALKTDLAKKIDKPATATNGQVLTWDGTNWVAQTPASAPDLSVYIPKAAYTAKGDLLVGTGSATYSALAGGARPNPVQLTLDAGGSPVWTPWQPQTIPWSMAGTAAVRTGAGRFYNDLGHNRVITTLRASAGTAPVGSALTVAVKVDGTQIGTVSIAAGANTATTTGLTAAFNAGSYVSVDVTAVGSTTAGADLVVGVTHRGA